MAVCQGAQRAGRAGERLVEAGREPPRGSPAKERLKYLGIAKDVGDAIDAFLELVEHLRDGQALAKEKAENAFRRRCGSLTSTHPASKGAYNHL